MDIPRLIEGGVDAQVLAVWISPRFVPNRAIKRTLRLVDAVYRQLEKYPDQIELALTEADVRRIVESERVAIILGIEGGHAIEDDMASLRMFYELGVRYMTLTWMNTNNWADAAGDTAKWNGLNELGVDVVKEMNRLGMIIDVSHVSDDTYFDVLRETCAPVIASHSCARHLCDHFRNMSDEMLRALAANGGVIGINFYSGYLDSGFAKASSPLWDAMHAERRRLHAEYEGDEEGFRKAFSAYRENQIAKLPTVPASAIVDHIMHVISVAGVEHVAFGSDFDGVSFLPEGIRGCQDVPKITELLVERGLPEADIRKILGENFLRVMKAVEEKGAEVRRSR